MKSILVTGDSKGVGLEIVKLILESSDFSIVGVSRSTSDATKKLLDKFPNRYHHFDFDIGAIDELEVFFKQNIKKHGPFLGLVNNAAIAYDDIVTNLKLLPLESMYRINVFAPMLMTKLIIRNMLLNKIEGSIIHISSISAHTGYKGLAMYASTKGALEAFSKNTAREWGEKGIRSNCVCPGFMETEMSANLGNDMKNRIYNRTSLKKATTLSSVAQTVLFLLVDKSSSITGQVYRVDSGTT